jgi:hypothetical protein
MHIYDWQFHLGDSDFNISRKADHPTMNRTATEALMKAAQSSFEYSAAAVCICIKITFGPWISGS